MSQGRSIEELAEENLGRKAIDKSPLMQLDFENKLRRLGIPSIPCVFDGILPQKEKRLEM